VRISDWSSDVCSSDLPGIGERWVGPVAAARVGIEIAPDEPHFLDAALQLGDRVLRRAARRLGKLADRREIAGIEVADAPDEIVADPRPLAAHLLVADVMAHAAGAGREDGEVGAPLPRQAKLVRLEYFADLVVRDRRVGGRPHLGELTMDVDPLLPPNLQVIRRCGVVAMAT